jgi:hypothetical protein
MFAEILEPKILIGFDGATGGSTNQEVDVGINFHSSQQS